jgi:hypothetical protein
MIIFLQVVATGKNITGQDMAGWVPKVHAKLHGIGITTIKETVSGTVTLNQELHSWALNDALPTHQPCGLKGNQEPPLHPDCFKGAIAASLLP